MTDIAINSRAFSAPRSFEPRELLPVPGRPQAAAHRPETSPGIIPVAESNAASETLDEDIEQQKLKSLDYQIIRSLLSPEDSDAKTEADKEVRSTTAINDVDETLPTPEPTPVSRTEVNITVRSVDVNINIAGGEQPPPVEPQRKSDPLVLDLDGNGLHTGENLVQFDIDADGQQDRISTLAGADAFLALDRNQNGRIDHGGELFGDQHGAANGFAELTRFDDNQDNRIDAIDSIYSSLRLYRPESGDLGSLAEAGIRAIELGYQDTRQALNTYDEIAQLGKFEYEDGRHGLAADLLFAKQ